MIARDAEFRGDIVQSRLLQGNVAERTLRSPGPSTASLGVMAQRGMRDRKRKERSRKFH